MYRTEFAAQQERCPGLYQLCGWEKEERANLVGDVCDSGVELLGWTEEGLDGCVIVPDCVYAVVAVARKRVGWTLGGGGNGTLADGRDISVEKGIEAFRQDVASCGGQGGVKGGTGGRIEGYHLLYHGLGRVRFRRPERGRRTRMP